MFKCARARERATVLNIIVICHIMCKTLKALDKRQDNLFHTFPVSLLRETLQP